MKKGCLFSLLGGVAVVVIFGIGAICNSKTNSVTGDTKQASVENPYAPQEDEKIENDTFLIEVNKEKNVADAVITEAGVLYVSVKDDGTVRDGYAQYFCQLSKDYNTTVNRVKIVQVGTAKSKVRDNAYGILLGEAWCK